MHPRSTRCDWCRESKDPGAKAQFLLILTARLKSALIQNIRSVTREMLTLNRTGR
jgi:hypothetical protein